MKKVLVLMFAALVSVGTSWAQNENQRTIEVYGYCEKEFTPDRIYIGFTLKENAKDKVTVVGQQTEVIKALKQLGINVDTRLTIKDMYGNTVGKNPRKSEVLQTRNYELLVTDAQTVGEVYSALQELKVYSLRINRVELSTYEDEKLKIMGEAVKNARRVADVLAESAGCRIYGVMQIVCRESLGHNTLAGDYVMLKSARMTGESSNAEPTPMVEFRKVKITSMVEVKYLQTELQQSVQ